MNMYTAIIAINPITARQCLRTVIFSNFIAEPIPFRLAKHLSWMQQNSKLHHAMQNNTGPRAN